MSADTPGPWSRVPTPDEVQITAISHGGGGRLAYRGSYRVVANRTDEEKLEQEVKRKDGVRRAIEEGVENEGRREVVKVIWNNPAAWDSVYNTREVQIVQDGGLHELRVYLKMLEDIELDGLRRCMKSLLHVACQHGRLAICVMLIAEFNFPVSAKSHKVGTPLHVAARWGREDITSYLVTFDDNESGLHSVVKTTGDTPLHCAATSGSVAVVRILDEQGVALGALNGKRQTPLILACSHRNEAAATYIAKRHTPITSIDCVDASSMTALYYCIRHGLIDLTKLLISKGASLNPIGLYWTPLQLASRSPHHEAALCIVKYLIEDCSQPPAAPERMFHNSPTAFAEKAGNARLVEYLEKFGTPDY